MKKIHQIGFDNSIEIKEVKNDYWPTNGSSLKGEIEITYKELIEKLGEPSKEWGDSYKSDCEWVLSTPEGIATIYNWKDGRNYLGNNGLNVEDITNWHIGGHNEKVVEVIKKLFSL